MTFFDLTPFRPSFRASNHYYPFRKSPWNLPEFFISLLVSSRLIYCHAANPKHPWGQVCIPREHKADKAVLGSSSCCRGISRSAEEVVPYCVAKLGRSRDFWDKKMSRLDRELIFSLYLCNTHVPKLTYFVKKRAAVVVLIVVRTVRWTV